MGSYLQHWKGRRVSQHVGGGWSSLEPCGQFLKPCGQTTTTRARVLLCGCIEALLLRGRLAAATMPPDLTAPPRALPRDGRRPPAAHPTLRLQAQSPRRVVPGRLTIMASPAKDTRNLPDTGRQVGGLALGRGVQLWVGTSARARGAAGAVSGPPRGPHTQHADRRAARLTAAAPCLLAHGSSARPTPPTPPAVRRAGRHRPRALHRPQTGGPTGGKGEWRRRRRSPQRGVCTCACRQRPRALQAALDALKILSYTFRGVVSHHGAAQGPGRPASMAGPAVAK
jgi:hypothetical protein